MHVVAECHLVEQLAYHDASVAWVVMICSDSGHYAGRLEDEVARALYPDMDQLTAGALFPRGRAQRTADGYRVSGRWPFGSGCLHADHIVGGCLVYDGDDLVLDDAGRPEMRVMWLPRAEVVIHDTWRTTGMAGTGSNDYEVDGVLIPARYGFHPFRPGPRSETLYRYQGFFLSNLGSVAIGTARRMIDDLAELAQTKVLMPSFTLMKDEARIQELLSEAAVAVGSARAYQDDRLHDVWDALERGDEPTREQRAGIGLLGINAVQSAVRASELVCEAVGSDAIYASSPFDRRRRDLVTMAAHVLGARKTYQMTGQLLLGADTPFSVF